jgi:hypothetical protein
MHEHRMSLHKTRSRVHAQIVKLRLQCNGLSKKTNKQLMVEAQQEVENALGQPPAKCPWCSAVLSPNDRNALKREVDATGATIEDMYHICFNRIPAMAVYIRPLFGVIFLRGHISLKNWT